MSLLGTVPLIVGEKHPCLGASFFHFKILHFFCMGGGEGGIHGARLGLNWLGIGDL